MMNITSMIAAFNESLVLWGLPVNNFLGDNPDVVLKGFQSREISIHMLNAEWSWKFSVNKCTMWEEAESFWDMLGQSLDLGDDDTDLMRQDALAEPLFFCIFTWPLSRSRNGWPLIIRLWYTPFSPSCQTVSYSFNALDISEIEIGMIWFGFF